MNLEQKINDSVMYSVWGSVDKSVWDSVEDSAYNSVNNDVRDKLKTYDFTTKNK